jgi:Ca2+-binding RTX toxin-like protein
VRRRYRLAVFLAGALLLALPATGAPAPTVGPLGEHCTYRPFGPPGPAGNRLVVVGDPVFIFRDGSEIQVRYWGPRCSGPQATVHNLDRIVVRAGGEGVSVDQGEGGRFAPGATPERGGSEIEFSLDSDRVEVVGTGGADVIRIRTRGGRVALNLNPDLDGARPDSDLAILGGIPGVLRVRGYKGDDRIDARRLTGMGDPYLRRVIRIFGDAGDDVIFGGPGGEWRLKDGPGNDLVVAGPGEDSVDFGRGRDRVYGGPGNDDLIYSTFRRFVGTPPDAADRLYGGPGDDQISDSNGQRDRVHCGPGFDRLETDPHDRLRDSDCERAY